MSKLFYIIGSSGAGKDTLINYCRSQVNGTLPVIFAHRYITRPAIAGGENHISLSRAEFELRLRHGLFTMNWEGNGLHYGIGVEIDIYLQREFDVVINGSRQYLKTAMEKYPNLQPILIEAEPELIKERLNNRGREDHKSILERISRNQQLSLQYANITRIQNNGALDVAAGELLNTMFSHQS